MFQRCSKLVSVDFNGWTTTTLTNTAGKDKGHYSIFNGCKVLSSVTFGLKWSWNSSTYTNAYGALPDAPTTGNYTGKWLNTSTGEALTAAEMCEKYNTNNTELSDEEKAAGIAGTWVWEEATPIMVTYDANAPEENVISGATEVTGGIAGGEVTIAACGFVSDAYEFCGWNATADGSGTSYAADDVASFDVDTTLYAQWELKTYTVTVPTYGKWSGMPVGKVNVECEYDVTVSGGVTAERYVTVTSEAHDLTYGEESLDVASASEETPLTYTSAGSQKDKTSIGGTARAIGTYEGYVEYFAKRARGNKVLVRAGDDGVTIGDVEVGDTYEITNEDGETVSVTVYDDGTATIMDVDGNRTSIKLTDDGTLTVPLDPGEYTIVRKGNAPSPDSDPVTFTVEEE